ncbi:MAG: hypothetical protein ICV67_02985 [Thermoleophilia bacterium]|nr:hypothetical protein [Thermoleophilia bacterium]
MRTQHHLRSLLEAHGAREFLISEDTAEAVIRFAIDERRVRIVLPLPSATDPTLTHTPGGRLRGKRAHERAYEQELRRHWRVALLMLRGKLEAIAIGASSVELEFPLNGPEGEHRTAQLRVLLSRSSAALAAGMLIPLFGLTSIALPANAVERVSAAFLPAGLFSYELGDSVGAAPPGLGGGEGSAPPSVREPLAREVAPEEATSARGAIGQEESGAPTAPGRPAAENHADEAVPVEPPNPSEPEAEPPGAHVASAPLTVEPAASAGPAPAVTPAPPRGGTGEPAPKSAAGGQSPAKPEPKDEAKGKDQKQDRGQSKDKGQGGDKGPAEVRDNEKGQGEGQGQGQDREKEKGQDGTSGNGRGQGNDQSPEGQGRPPQAGETNPASENDGGGQAPSAGPPDHADRGHEKK